jgi:hypothetical protein
MLVVVGEHHQGPPPPYAVNSPRWIICEYAGTGRTFVAVIVVVEVDDNVRVE